MQIFSKLLPMAVAIAFGLTSLTSAARTTNANLMRMSRAEAIGTQNDYEPDSSVSGIRNYGDVDGPNGELWYYTVNLITKNITHDYWVERILTEYIFTLYDAQMNEVGKIHDKMRYAADETGVPGPENGCELLPVVTKNFFNADDKYEVVISLAVNTTTEGKNNYRSVVYSLGGEKESLEVEDVTTGQTVTKQFDKPIAQYPAFIADVLDASTSAGEEYYMTFYGDIYGSEKNVSKRDENSDYWEAIKNEGEKYHVYGHVGSDGRLTDVLDFFIPYLNMQGDQESTPPVVTFARENKGYVVVPRYAEPFFNPYGPNDDMTMRENNSLAISVYELSGSSSKKIQETSVPVVKMPGDGVIATYYSVGDLRGSKDVNFGDFTQDGRASFYVTRCNYTSSGDETSDFSYYVYDPDGNKIRTIFENAISSYSIADIDGVEPQHMFVSYDEAYAYNFVNLLTGYDNKTVTIDSYVDAYNTGDEESKEFMLANVARVPIGDTYKYAFEMREPLIDENGSYIRVCWFDSKGKFERVDHVNMGSNVDYAQCYISSHVLIPTLFCADATHEYCVLIKRSQVGTSELTEELMISQPTEADLTGGKTLLYLTPSPSKGKLSGINVYNYDDKVKKLMVSYLDAKNNFTVDFYDLPFHLSGIETITPDSAFENISFDGNTLRAEGVITVYTVGGKAVAEGNGFVSVASLSSGIYVAVNGTSAYKFQVK